MPRVRRVGWIRLYVNLHSLNCFHCVELFFIHMEMFVLLSQCYGVIYAKARAIDLCTVWSHTAVCVRVCVSRSSDKHGVWTCSINQLWISLLIRQHTNQACSTPACLTLTSSLISATLRALYLSDNDFEILPPDIGKLTKLQIVSNLSKFTLKSILFFTVPLVGFIL